MASLKLHKELEKVFGPDDAPTVPTFYLKQLLRLTFSGKMSSEGLRPLCWRVFLGIISRSDKSLWKDQLAKQVTDYEVLKKNVLPSLDKVKSDPLSAFGAGDGQNEEWTQYYKNVELQNFIKGDLDRLYLTGIEEENYFQTKVRRSALLSILFLWSLQNPSTSYRQGMHEIVGCILFVIETERLAWEKAISRKEMSVNHSMVGVFSASTIEAHTYYLYDRLMMELQPLYDPVPTRSHGAEGQPFVVQFCTKIQEHYLRILDPDLCSLLEDSYVQAQLYGLRWSRLMLGREFAVTSSQLFTVWDYIFACCFDAEQPNGDDEDDTLPTNVYSMLANARLSGNTKSSNLSTAHRAISDKFTYVYTPLLGALGDFMLAMLLHIRAQLIDSDANSVMGYLMHYPEVESVQPIVEFVDMIRRGVIIQESNLFVNVQASQFNDKSSPTPPSWLMKSSNSVRGNLSAPSTLNGVGKKFSEKLSAVKVAVGNGLNDLVQTINEYSEQHSAQSQADLSAAAAAMTFSQEPNKVYKTQPITDFDPLMGSTFTGNTASSKTASSTSAVKTNKTSDNTAATATSVTPPPTLPLPVPPQPTGLGTGYANMEGVAPASTTKNKGKSTSGSSVSDHDDSDPFMMSSATPVTPARHGSMTTMFTPTSWFPSTSTTSIATGGGKLEKKRDKRSSGGVDLHMLQTSLKGGATSNSNAGQDSKSSALANNNGVGDRLLDIADSLVHPAYKSINATLLEGRELEFEAEIRKETVRRLRALADVLAGLSTIVDYDTKFANQQASGLTSLGTSSAPAVAPVSVPTSLVSIVTATEQTGPLSAFEVDNNTSGGNSTFSSPTKTSNSNKVSFATTISPLLSQSRSSDDGDDDNEDVISDAISTTETVNETVSLAPSEEVTTVDTQPEDITLVLTTEDTKSEDAAVLPDTTNNAENTTSEKSDVSLNTIASAVDNTDSSTLLSTEEVELKNDEEDKEDVLAE